MKKLIRNVLWTIVYIALRLALTIVTTAHYFGGQLCMQVHRLLDSHYCSKHGPSKHRGFLEVYDGYYRRWEMSYHNGKEHTVE